MTSDPATLRAITAAVPNAVRVPVALAPLAPLDAVTRVELEEYRNALRATGHTEAAIEAALEGARVEASTSPHVSYRDAFNALRARLPAGLR